jgi:hypothetical protein
MLDGLARQSGSVLAFRLSNSKSKVEALMEMGVDPDDIDGSMKYFGEIDVSPEKHLDWIFSSHGQQGQSQSRYTDGAIPVLYCALNIETASAEVAHWLPHPLEGQVFYYFVLAVEFLGDYKNLCDLVPVPDFLTGEAKAGAYGRCLRVTKSAVMENLDAWMTPSARHHRGVCFPIISRSAVRKLKLVNHLKITFDSAIQGWVSKMI